MERSVIRSALACALLVAGFGLSACHDDRPYRGDRHPMGYHDGMDHPDDGGHDRDRHE